MIKFLKILEYELRPNNVNVYDYISAVVSQEIDPPSLKKGELFIDAPLVFCSSLKRAMDCIQNIPTTEYVFMPELKEILFNFKEICSQEEWSNYGSKIVRKKFKKMFQSDSFSVSRKKIFDEIKYVLGECKKRKNQNIVIVSHSFRLKLIEAFIKTKGKIEKNPEIIEDFIKDDEKTYNFGSGFEIDV
jgi:hypothetical protein